MDYIIYAKNSKPDIIKSLRMLDLEHNSINKSDSKQDFYKVVDNILLAGYNVEIKFDGDYREVCVF